MRYGGFLASVSAARVLGLAITFVTFPIIVRRLGVETYGLWSYVVAVCAFFEVAANPGLTTYVTQQVAAQRHQAATLIPDFFILRLISVLVAIVVLLAVASFEARSNVRWLLRFYGVANLCVGLTGADFLLNALELFHIRSALTLAQQALYGVGVLVLIHGPNDIVWLPVSILGSSLITNLAGWFVLRRKNFRPPLMIQPSRWRSILVPSLHYAATTMLATAYHRTGHLVVHGYLGEYALGLYAAAIRFVDVLRNFVTTAFTVLMPRMALAAQSRAGLRRLVHASVSALAIVGIPLMLGTISTAHLVVPWVLGKNYLNAVQPVRLVAPLLLAGPMASLLSGTVLYALGRHRAYLASGAVGALTAVILSFTLVRAGLPGVCVAFILGEVAVALTAYCLIPHELRDLWKNPIILVATFSSVVMVAAVRLVNAHTANPLIVPIAGALVYLGVLTITGRRLLLRQFGEAP
jgi:polysaccharide transporter, PST family